MEVLVFTVYLKRVGADSHEWPVSVIIAEDEEQKYREYHRGREWNAWADRNGIYRCCRVEAVPFVFEKHHTLHKSERMVELLKLTEESLRRERIGKHA